MHNENDKCGEQIFFHYIEKFWVFFRCILDNNNNLYLFFNEQCEGMMLL